MIRCIGRAKLRLLSLGGLPVKTGKPWVRARAGRRRPGGPVPGHARSRLSSLRGLPEETGNPGCERAQVGVGLLGLYQVCSRGFAGQVVAQLPFEPVWWFKGLAHRGLPEGHAATACGMVSA